MTTQPADPQHLLVVWTSGDREVAEHMVFMYTLNSRLKEWWPQVTLLIWGPSQRLLTEDADLQAYLARMQQAGVRTIACKACANEYGLADKLEALGVEVFFTGTFLTEWLQSGRKMLTF
jgi:hypothetical protein